MVLKWRSVTWSAADSVEAPNAPSAGERGAVDAGWREGRGADQRKPRRQGDGLPAVEYDPTAQEEGLGKGLLVHDMKPYPLCQGEGIEEVTLFVDVLPSTDAAMVQTLPHLRRRIPDVQGVRSRRGRRIGELARHRQAKVCRKRLERLRNRIRGLGGQLHSHHSGRSRNLLLRGYRRNNA